MPDIMLLKGAQAHNVIVMKQFWYNESDYKTIHTTIQTAVNGWERKCKIPVQQKKSPAGFNTLQDLIKRHLTRWKHEGSICKNAEALDKAHGNTKRDTFSS